ncbi:MAG: zf-HC2 domain-containing protein [Candidatus Neomarinimicrobiota bacterium]
MDCSDFQVLISQYLDSELSFIEQKTFLQHKGDCEGCADLIARMEELKSLLRQEVPVSLSIDFVSRLQERLRRELNRQPAWWQRLSEPGSTGFSPVSLGGLAAAAAFVIIIGVSLFQQEAAPLVEPSAKSLQAGPSLQFTPDRSGGLNAAAPAPVSAEADSVQDNRDTSGRDFSRQMKYVNQGTIP